MELTLRRKFKGAAYTIGDLSLDGKFFCNTIEDAVRDLPAECPDTLRGKSCACKEKVYARTAIPAGEYKITLEYSPRFKLSASISRPRHDSTSYGNYCSRTVVPIAAEKSSRYLSDTTRNRIPNTGHNASTVRRRTCRS